MEPAQLENLKADLSLRNDVEKAGHAALVEEYKALWNYYLRTLDERARMFDIYFRLISIPFVLTGAVILYIRSFDLQSRDTAIAQKFSSFAEMVTNGLGIFFSLSCIAGLATYLYYCLESGNSRRYLNALNAIRANWRDKYQLHDSLVIDLLRPKSNYTGDWIVHSRGAVFAIFNSSIFFASIWFYFGESFLTTAVEHWTASIAVFAFAIGMHMVIGVIAMQSYGLSPDVNSIIALIDSQRRVHTAHIVGRSVEN